MSRPLLARRRSALLLATLCALTAFTVAVAEAFFLPSGEEVHNTGDPHVIVTSGGDIHLVYPLVAAAGAVYAHCPADCAGPEQLRTVSFATDELGSVHTALLALDERDVPHVLLSTGESVLYGVCDGSDCGDRSSWSLAVIHGHDGDWELTGDAFAIDPVGRPTFLLHAYQAYLGLFGPEPGTRLFVCDGGCLDADAWRSSQVSEQSWLEPTLRFDAAGAMHVAAVVPIDDGDLVGYFRCDAGCDDENADNWPGVGIAWAFSDRYVEEVYPAVALALTSSGGVRVAYLGVDGDERYLGYYECEAGCTAGADGWAAMTLLAGEGAADLGDGIDLALDAFDRPRLAYTVQGNILLAHCDVDCAGRGGNADWNLSAGELSGDIPADDVFLVHNCTVGVWFLRQPSVAIGADGLPVLAYRAEDISGGVSRPDSTRPACVAGVDMSLTRFNRLASY